MSTDSDTSGSFALASVGAGSEPPSLTLHAPDLVTGCAYRVRLTGESESPPGIFFRQLRIKVEPEEAGGSEHFAYRRKGGAWIVDLPDRATEAVAEFRLPEGADKLEIQAVPRTSSKPAEQTSVWRFELLSIAPTIPANLLRNNADSTEAAQERCEILDLSSLTDSLVPLRPDAQHASTPLDELEVAYVGSRRLQTELAFNCAITELREEQWRESLTDAPFDFLLVEPVLHVDHEWRFVMTRNGRREAIVALLDRCRQLGIPRVLWMRVEPDLYPEFSWLVPHFDHVFAVDHTIQSMLAAEFPTLHSDVLPPAVQPRLHNPVRTRSSIQQLGAAFEGTVLMDGWWKAANERDSELLYNLKKERLLITESTWEFSYTRLDTLPQFRWNTIGCLSKDEKSLLARHVGAELFILDETLGNWRQQEEMLRSAACGAVALYRNEGLGSPLIDEGLCWHGDDATLLRSLALLTNGTWDREAWRHRVSREVLEHHSYAARLDKICRRLGLREGSQSKPRVANLLVSMRPWLLGGCIDRFKQDLYPNKELVIVVHGEASAVSELRLRADGDERISIHRMGKERSLGACLNFASAQTDAQFWAKIDDDDLYGPRYLSDMMLYQAIGDYSLLAKPPAFLYFEALDELRWHPARARRAWVHHPAQGGEPTLGIAGGTLIGRTSVLEEVPFSETRRGGSDSDLVKRARAAGHDLLVTDPFNFGFFRSGSADFHTWNTDMTRLRKQTHLAGGRDAITSAVFV